MAKQFNIPSFYDSTIIGIVKQARQAADPRKKDLKPVMIDFGHVQFHIPRHFGFCYGVQNAIDIAYRTIEEANERNVYLLSEMIHNPVVNDDLQRRGVKFLFETDGSVNIPIDSLTEADIVIVPAFGTTLDIEERLKNRGIDPYSWDTTCPFVEKVWKRGGQLGKKGYNLVIHGKVKHEETRATFSHAQNDARAVIVVLNVEEAKFLADCMKGMRSIQEFNDKFEGKYTPGFDPIRDLQRFGVINQTTMLATETQEVIQVLRDAAIELYGESDIEEHVADTSDTLCYATNENQSATLELMKESIDIALVVGGFNSSNTMHIVELLERVVPTYHVRGANDMPSPALIRHFNQWEHKEVETANWLDITKRPIRIGLTSGASCPDALVDEVMLQIVSWVDDTKSVDEALMPFRQQIDSITI
jgi:4-hydroxy-3-methylbut-2-en-1-yl diphosphate reductase